MDWRAVHVTALGAILLSLWSTTTAKADDQQLVQEYLLSRGVSGAVVRPVTDDFVGRTFRLVEEGGGPIKEILA